MFVCCGKTAPRIEAPKVSLWSLLLLMHLVGHTLLRVVSKLYVDLQVRNVQKTG
jgi:hypothetical protein